MTNSILESVRSVLVSPDDTSFDDELIMHINGVFLSLNELGIGPTDVFSIEGDTEVWSDFTGNIKETSVIRTYMALKVKIAFDPPTNSTLLDSLRRNLDELEWRLHNIFNYGGTSK